MPFDAILLIAFGGPEKMDEVRPFLANVLRGRPVPPQRLEAVVGHYALFNGHSPLKAITLRQASALHAALAREGLDLPVYVGMRNWHPYLHETLDRMAADGVGRALGVIMSAQQSEAGWQRYKHNVAAAQEQVGSQAPRVDYAPGWHNHPLFIDAVSALTQRAFTALDQDRRTHTPLVFTAHSVPSAMPGVAQYVAQIEEGARLVADKLGRSAWCVAYQSRSGDSRTAWLEPDIDTVLRQLAAEGARDLVVCPIGFVCDHMEVLYDLDTEARRVAERLGLNMRRASTVNDHPRFIQMLAAVVRREIERV